MPLELADMGIRILGLLCGLTMTALALSLAGWITGKNLLSQLFTEPPRLNPHQSARQTKESPANTYSLSLPDGDGPTAGRRDTTATSRPSRPEPRVTPIDTTLRPDVPSRTPHVIDPPPYGTGAPPKVGVHEGASGGGPTLSGTARPAPRASVPSKQAASTLLSAETATPDGSSAPSESALRAELLHEPVLREWGNSYSVRLLNFTGQPMQVFGVLLVTRMTDGNVEETAMDASAEPGVYRGTVPFGRSTPVDLRVRVRVRVTTGDRFVEVPLTP